MVVKTHFELTTARAVKLRRLAEYYAAEYRTSVDTQAFLNHLIEHAYDLMDDEKRQARTRQAVGR